MTEDNPPPATVKKAPARKGPKIPKKITEKYLYNSGLAYLQRFPSSVAHFKTVMGRKIDRSCRHHADQDREVCATLLDKVAAHFTEMGYLNDELYLRGMVNSLRGRGLSAMLIRMKLKHKGLAEDDIREVLTAFDEEHESDDLSAALKLCRRKKIGSFAVVEADQALKQKWLATLARAGFSYDTASRAINTLREEADL